MDPNTAVIWDQGFLDYELSPDHPLNPVRLELTMSLATELGVLRDVELLPAKPADDEDLLRAHSAEYLEVVRDLRPGDVDYEHGLGTNDNPVFDRMHEAAAHIVGGSIEAARRITSGGARRAISLAGGLHHGMRSRAAGFCVYNDCVAAIARLLADGVERVAYIDIDVHHGDGVQAAFWDDPRVLTVSLHQHPMTLWPRTGYPHETGGPEALGSVVNLALPAVAGDIGWQRAFHAVVPSVVRAFRPQVLVTQCGVDTHRDDPLADLRLTVDGHRRIFRELRSLAEEHADGRWLALGGGGYSLVKVVPRSWTHLLAVMLNRDVAPNTPLPADWTAHVSGLARDIPSSMTDGGTADFPPWDGTHSRRFELLDETVDQTRQAVFPALGLDPADPDS